MIEYCLFLPVGYIFYYFFSEEEKNGEIYKKIKNVFSDVELLEVKKSE